MAIVLSILCGAYGLYCTSFCCSVGYTLIEEHYEEKRKKQLEIKKQYHEKQLQEFLQENGHNSYVTETFELARNYKLTTIVEEMEMSSSDEENEVLYSNYSNSYYTEKTELL